MGGRRILITGGAGLIGSHLADHLLLARGDAVRAFDVLSSQVHGPDAGRPEYLDGDVELVTGDCRDRDAVRAALRGVDAVGHLAVAVGVGQSMYEVDRYVSVNDLGTAVLLQALIESPVGYEPRVGLVELARWLEGRIPHGGVGEASAELAARGLSL